MNEHFSIRQEALKLGFDCCGVARSRPLDEYRDRLIQWLNDGHHGGLAYLQRHVEKRLDPALLHPGTRSIIVCGMGYKRGNAPNPMLSHIASYAWGRDYHLVIREKLDQLLQILRQTYPGASGRVFVDTAPVMEKAWAIEAGLGWRGRNTLLIHPQWGSYLLLGVILTDAELEPDTPYAGHCGTCRRCIQACPTGALSEDGVLDAGRCISRRTIEPGSPETEENLHGWIFGCDLCQRACPYNLHVPESTHPEWKPLPEWATLTPQDWINMDASTFKTLFRESPLGRCGLERLQHRMRHLLSEKN